MIVGQFGRVRSQICVVPARVKKCLRLEPVNSVLQHGIDNGFPHESCKIERADGLEPFLAEAGKSPPFMTAGPAEHIRVTIRGVAPDCQPALTMRDSRADSFTGR